MTVAENKDLVRRYTAEMWAEGNIGNEAALRKYLCPSFRRHMSPTLPPLDLEGQIKWLAGIQSAFPNITITLEDLVREGDRVVLQKATGWCCTAPCEAPTSAKSQDFPQRGRTWP
jgi:hypothetical protein